MCEILWFSATSEGVPVMAESGNELGKRTVNLIGQKFGRLEVISFSRVNKNRFAMWLCACDCGRKVTLASNSLKRSKKPTKSCGCLAREKTAMRRFKHGMTKLPEMRIWIKMKRRCFAPDEHGYENYGARGIGVCEAWKHDFKKFFDDVGPRPTAKHTLERIDNNGHYEPGNVRWATRKEQQRNRRTNHLITFGGQTLCLAEWAERIGISSSAMNGRFRRGWTIEECVTVPPMKQFDQSQSKKRP
jgi:hypothetical protein